MPPLEPQKGDIASQSTLNTPIEKSNSKLYLIGTIAFAPLLFVGIAFVLYQPSFNQDLFENKSGSDLVLATSTGLENLEELKTVDESIVEIVRNDASNVSGGIPSGVNVSEWFIKNEKGVYLIYPDEKLSFLVEGVDANSFSYLEGGFYKDKTGIYYLSIREGLTLVLEKLVGIDPTTFEVFKSSSFIKDNNGIHLYNRVGTLVLLPDLDQTTFQIVNTVYAKDKNGTYALKTVNQGQRTGLYVYKMLGADNTTLQLIEAQGDYLRDRIAKDSRSVYYAGAKIPLADPNSFQILNEYFVYDGMYVYAVVPDNSASGYDQLVLLKGVEAKNFKLLHDFYATDGVRVFVKYHADAVRGADPETFEPYKDQWGADARDANHIYSDGKIILYPSSISDANFKTWEGEAVALREDESNINDTFHAYVTDGLYVYYSGRNGAYGNTCQKESASCLVELVEGADPATFQRVGETDYWKDKNRMYLKGEKTQ